MFDINAYKKDLEKMALNSGYDWTDLELRSKYCFRDKTITDVEGNMICHCIWAIIESRRLKYPKTVEEILKNITPEAELEATLEYLKTFELAIDDGKGLEKKILDALVDYERPMPEKALCRRINVSSEECRQAVLKLIRKDILSFTITRNCNNQDVTCLEIKQQQ